MSNDLLDKVKKQLRDITDLYDKERDKSNVLEQTIRDLRRREPIVQMLWQEVLLLRRIIERHLHSGAMQMNLPTGRLDQTQKDATNNTMTDKDRIAYLALRLIQNDQSSQGMTTDDLVRNFAPQITAEKETDSWLSGSADIGALGAGNSRLSVIRSDANQRIEGIKSFEASLDHLHGQGPNKEISFAEAAGLSSSADLTSSVDAAESRPKSPFAAAIAAAAGKKAAGEPQQRSQPTTQAGGNSLGADGHEYDANGIPKAPQDLFDGIPFGAGKNNNSGGTAIAATQSRSSGPEPSKPMLKPKLKMKPFHWKQIIIGAKGRRSSIASRSIWQDVDPLYDQILTKALNTAEFEAKFQSAAVKGGVEGGASAAVEEEVADDKPRRLLDAKRHNQLSFMLSKMPNFEAMKTAILTLDNKAIPSDKLEALHKSLPTSEEISAVANCGIPSEKLQLPEQWIRVMATIPQLSARIECWRFSQTFDEQYTELHKPLSRVETACMAIRNSGALKKYMAIVLAVGNYMNGGTPRGQADGFTFDSLSKIARIKNAEGDGSLLDFTNQLANEIHGEQFFSSLTEELSLLSEVRSTSLKQISGEGRKLSSKLDLIVKMQSLVSAQAEANDPFESSMSEFNASASRKVKSLETLCRGVFSSFVNLMLYLEPTMEVSKAEQTNTEEFFAAVDDFAVAVVRTNREAKRKRELAEARIKQAQHMQHLRKVASGSADAAPRAKPRRTVFNSSGAPVVQLRSTASANTSSSQENTDENVARGSGGFGPISAFPKLKPVNRDDTPARTNDDSSPQGANPFVKLRPVDRSNDKPVATSSSSDAAPFVFAKLRPINRDESRPAVRFGEVTNSKGEQMVQLKPISKSNHSPPLSSREAPSKDNASSTIPIDVSVTTTTFVLNGDDSDSDANSEDPPPPPNFDDMIDFSSDSD